MHLPEHFSEGVALLHREFRVCYATLVDAVHLEHLHVQDRHPGPILRSTAVHCTAPQHQHCTALRRCTMHCTAHTTRATRECASMHTRTWHGRARAWTHLGTRAAGAGRWTALLNRRIRPLDQPRTDESSAAVPRSSQKKWISGCCFWLILERRRRDFRAGSGGCGLKPALPGLTVAASGSWVADLARKTGGRLEGVRSIEGGVRSIDFGANPKID